MRVVNTGNTYRIYDNSLQTFDQLPAQAYTICFHPQQGFWLEKFSDLEVNEKIYGVHTVKVEKVFKSFGLVSRNMGVILSGAKGIGKSLFAKLLSIKAVENGYPLIIVNSYIPGIADFINEIEQEVVVLFDEFDKTFNGGKDKEGSARDPQTEMLTLFDGISMGKKLFVVTCNELRNLNDYLVNRPGRFHYHFRFDYPQAEEIREYLQDKVDKAYWKEIDHVISFSKKVNLNYDCLRAIAFELALGLSFKEAIADLNIINLSSETYTLILCYPDGTKLTLPHYSLDMFSDNEICAEFDHGKYYDFLYVHFIPSDNVYDLDKGGCIIKGGDLRIQIDSDYKDSEDPQTKAMVEKFTAMEPECMLIKRKKAKSLHYAV